MDNENKGLGPIHDLLVAAGARGERNTYPSKDLAKISGAKDTRQLQEMIVSEINPIDPILSSSRGGYFLRSHGPEGRCEIVKNRDTVQKRGVHTLSRSSLLNQAIELWDLQHSGQTVIDLDDVEVD